MSVDLFNLTAYLDNKGIDWSPPGKNVSRGWVGVSCPFCPSPDPSYHLGIREIDNYMNCWRCDRRGPVTILVQEIENCSWQQAETIIEKWQDYSAAQYRREMPKIAKGAEGFVLPFEAEKAIPQKYSDYIKSRNFDPAHVIRKYDLYACGPAGDFKHRIIIPIKMNRKVVAFTGRDVTNKSDLPYKDCPVEQSLVPVKHCLYPIDNLRDYDTAILVEGALDTWRLGDGAVCMFTSSIRPEQLSLLRGLNRVFIMLDEDATGKAERVAHKVSNIIPSVEILELTEGDPCDLSNDEVAELRRDLFG